MASEGASPGLQFECVDDHREELHGAEDAPSKTLRLCWYLAFGQVQVDGDFVASQSSQVVVMSKLRLQFSDLLLGEGRALLPGFAAAILRL